MYECRASLRWNRPWLANFKSSYNLVPLIGECQLGCVEGEFSSKANLQFSVNQLPHSQGFVQSKERRVIILRKGKRALNWGSDRTYLDTMTGGNRLNGRPLVCKALQSSAVPTCPRLLFDPDPVDWGTVSANVTLLKERHQARSTRRPPLTWRHEYRIQDLVL
jgi:hypothetical protein